MKAAKLGRTLFGCVQSRPEIVDIIITIIVDNIIIIVLIIIILLLGDNGSIGFETHPKKVGGEAPHLLGWAWKPTGHI